MVGSASTAIFADFTAGVVQQNRESTIVIAVVLIGEPDDRLRQPVFIGGESHSCAAVATVRIRGAAVQLIIGISTVSMDAAQASS